VPSPRVDLHTLSRCRCEIRMRPQMSCRKPRPDFLQSGLMTTIPVDSMLSTMTTCESYSASSYCTPPCAFFNAMLLTYIRSPAASVETSHGSQTLARRPWGRPAQALSEHNSSGLIPGLSWRRRRGGVDAMWRIPGRHSLCEDDALHTSEFASETGPHAFSTSSPQVALF